MNLTGSIDLLKMKGACVNTIKGVRCLIVPVDDNNIYISADQNSLEPKAAYLGLNVYERRNESNYGATHFAKQSFSKAFREANPQEVEERKKTYLGDFKPNEINIPQYDAPSVAVDDESKLPF